MTEFGYAGKILTIDLSDGSTASLPSVDYADRFLGGRGMAAKLYWDLVPPQTGALDPDNCLICVTGPVAGFTGLAGCRWQICAKSPAMDPEAFSYANLGDRWGSWLKYAGYDGLVVRGKAAKPVYLFINNDIVEIRDASSLWGQPTFEAADRLKAELGKAVSVLTIGPAAENLVCFATMLTDDGSSGASGLGSVMGSKRLKAIVAAGNKRPRAADPERLSHLAQRVLELRKDTWKNWFVDIPGRTRLRPCYGCVSGCFRKSYQAEGGRRFKFFCQPVHVYWEIPQKYHDDWQAVSLLAIRLCDRYGLDTTVMQPLIAWLSSCYQEGVLREEDTGLPLSRIGSAEFIEELTRKIALREGFGDLLARGTINAAARVGSKAQQLLSASILTRANETRDYDPRLVLTNALFYATEPRRPINQVHELTHALWMWLNWSQGQEDAFLSYDDLRVVAENFWGGAAAADFSTYEGKALAAKKIQDRAYAKESLILCDFLWPIIWVRFAENHTGDPTMESRVLSAITGKEIDQAGLNKIGERIYNLQRAILLRQGRGGRQGDRLMDYLHEEPLQDVFFNPECLVPGQDGEIVSRQGAKIERTDFEKLKSEYYQLRGWEVKSGLPTDTRLRDLELGDVAADLKARDLLR
ncbi:Tungsten-containing aldehyde:ferredoxin oxidoreductase (EC [Olavius sp. associated proteobacterium Delta 1]|nr:Tungsten-containing aldehyde:ferredoxin oxidoreductase (EC [Olavius sp. associated proteobacterium Delta 1]